MLSITAQQEAEKKEKISSQSLAVLKADSTELCLLLKSKTADRHVYIYKVLKNNSRTLIKPEIFSYDYYKCAFYT